MSPERNVNPERYRNFMLKLEDNVDLTIAILGTTSLVSGYITRDIDLLAAATTLGVIAGSRLFWRKVTGRW